MKHCSGPSLPFLSRNICVKVLVESFIHQQQGFMLCFFSFFSMVLAKLADVSLFYTNEVVAQVFWEGEEEGSQFEVRRR